MIPPGANFYSPGDNIISWAKILSPGWKYYLLGGNIIGKGGNIIAKGGNIIFWEEILSPREEILSPGRKYYLLGENIISWVEILSPRWRYYLLGRNIIAKGGNSSKGGVRSWDGMGWDGNPTSYLHRKFYPKPPT